MWRRIAILPLVAIAMTAIATAEERPGISDQVVASLQQSVDASYREARKTFLFNEDFAGEAEDRSPFTLTVDGWKRRQAACIDNRCRLAELTAQLDRLNFANGVGRRPVQGMPWRTGSFLPSATGVGGSLSILPVGDGSVVASITTFSMTGRDWDCAGFTATGTLSENGTARMTLYEADADQGQAPVTFTLQAFGLTTVRLSPDSPKRYDDICRTGTILGTYKATAS